MTRGMTCLCTAVLGTLLSAAAVAQTLYKSTMPDGRVIFAHTPAPGAAKVETVKTVAPRPGSALESTKPDASKTAGKQAAQADPAVVKKLQEEKLKREQAEAKVRAAEKSWRAAEEALKKGESPLPGERIATASGQSQLSPEYWARQRRLKDDVENTRGNLERTRAQAR